jgi:hypothetical protein
MNQNAQTKRVEEVAKNVATLKVVETPKATEEVKKEIVPMQSEKPKIEEVKIAPLVTAEQKLKNLDLLQIISAKFRFLKTKADELSKFILSSDGTKEKITMSNASGFIFEVTNSQTIEKVLKVVEDDLASFIERADKEILDFKI